MPPCLYSVALKHYLRGEEGTNYTDLYHLVKYLPAYALPTGIGVTSNAGVTTPPAKDSMDGTATSHSLPFPATAAGLQHRTPTITLSPPARSGTRPEPIRGLSTGTHLTNPDEVVLLPARNPPKLSLFDFFPFSLFVKLVQSTGRELKGRKALRDKARRKKDSGNVPLEITLYLSSYIAALQNRRASDGLSISA